LNIIFREARLAVVCMAIAVPLSEHLQANAIAGAVPFVCLTVCIRGFASHRQGWRRHPRIVLGRIFVGRGRPTGYHQLA
jgi:hypothetical protein